MSQRVVNVDDKGRVCFWCEGCRSIHEILIAPSGPPTWTFNGDVVRPTFAPSVRVSRGRDGKEICHFYVTNGRIQYLVDCTHILAGKTVDMKPIMEGGAT